MQKTGFLTLLLLLILNVSWAKNEELRYNEQELKQNFKQIDAIEEYLSKHEGVTYEELSERGIFDLSTLKLEKNVANFSLTQNDNLLGISAFWWGCCLGVFGVLLVYIMTDNDKSEVRKSLKGLLTAVGVAIGLYVIYIVVFLSLISTNGL